MTDRAIHTADRKIWLSASRRRLGQSWKRFRSLWQLWKERHHFRNELYRLQRISPHLIADIGMTAGEARREIAKPIWRE